jgi:RNA polymerase sigma-70 factor (ECF subfamily)
MVRTKEELERYFKEYYGMIYRVAFSQLKNHADAEDITQEMFIKIIKSEDEFESAEHEKAWIIRAAINMCRDLLKSGWHKSFVGLDEVPEQEKAYYDNPYVKTDDILWQVLQLPEKFRNCIYLFYYEDNSIKEIAQILEMPENTVKTNLRRGKELLRKMIK